MLSTNDIDLVTYILAIEDIECENHYTFTISRELNSRYETSLPFKNNPNTMYRYLKSSVMQFAKLCYVAILVMLFINHREV